MSFDSARGEYSPSRLHENSAEVDWAFPRIETGFCVNFCLAVSQSALRRARERSGGVRPYHRPQQVEQEVYEGSKPSPRLSGRGRPAEGVVRRVAHHDRKVRHRHSLAHRLDKPFLLGPGSIRVAHSRKPRVSYPGYRPLPCRFGVRASPS